MKKGFLSISLINKLNAELTDRHINNTFLLGIPVYKINNLNIDFEIFMMQYNPFADGEDLRGKDLWYFFGHSYIMNNKQTGNFIVSDILLKQDFFSNEFIVSKFKKEFDKLNNE